MASTPRIPLGAPGLYPFPDVPVRTLESVRMDVCAFAGVAPRGPARLARRSVPVPVESFDEYRRLYGGFEGPGLLPYAVASFFEQGGRRAYIVRVVHDYGSPAVDLDGTAQAVIPGISSPAGPLRLYARNEGRWGNLLRAALTFTARPLAFDPAGFTLARFELLPGSAIPAGALLRLNYTGGVREFRFAALCFESRVTFDLAATAIPASIEIVEAALALDDPAGVSERHERLGLSAAHPRWLGAILNTDSLLALPAPGWLDSSFTPDDPGLSAALSASFDGGADRYRDITPEDFFDPRWTPGDEEPGDGIHSLAQLPDLSLLAVPDLYSPFPLAPPRKLVPPVPPAGPEFALCLHSAAPPAEPEPPLEDIVQLRLDPAIPSDLETITDLQVRVVEFAASIQQFVALLDVPPGLTRRRILSWRARFSSSYAACYHPWLFTIRQDDDRDVRIALPPSAPAAGIIAAVEITSGVPHGPANKIAAGIIDVRDLVPSVLHDEFHPLGINVYLLERDGVRLTAARTLSADASFRQLSVRRLLTLIRRSLDQEMQWTVFEPNGPALRAELRQLLKVFLRRLFLAGAFRGATEDESFFVRCDDTNNPPYLGDLGRLLVEIGVAPSEPLEFIVLRLSRDGDGSLTTTEGGR